MKIVFYTISSDEFISLRKYVENSFRYFHPDIPLVIYGQDEIDKIAKENNGVKWGWNYCLFGRRLIDDYDVVVHLDSDQIILDRLDEVLDGGYEMGAVYNNNPFEPFGAWLREIDPELDPKRYVNIGLHAITKKEIYDEWHIRNLKAMGDWRYHWAEQDVFNEIFHSRKYKTKIFDGLRGDYGTPDVYYGLSGRLQNKMMRLEGEKIVLNHRPVKVFHEAGGSMWKMADKLNIDELFVPEVAERIKKICNV